MKRTTPIFGLFFLLIAVNLYAQENISYQALVMRSHQPRFYYEALLLPSEKAGEQQLLVTFKIENDFLTFQKVDDASQSAHKSDHFHADYQISLEVFKADSTLKLENRRRPENEFPNFSDRDRMRSRRFTPRRTRMPKTEMVTHSYYRGSVDADTYEETQSNKKYAQGYLTVDLAPGKYQYVLALTQTNADNANHSSVSNLIVPPKPAGRPFITFVQDTNGITVPGKVALVNFGHSVIYGKDFGVFFRIPDYKPGDQYELSISKLSFSRKDTASDKIYKTHISKIISGVSVEADPDTEKVTLNLDKSPNGSTFGFADLPNHTFPDAAYRMVISDSTTGHPVAFKIFQSDWIDMPTSLLNLDVAIDMLKYIMKPKQVDEFRKGDYKEREERFKEFWKKKDPTPNTDYNELMAEYYRRIDYAYEHFSSLREPGYDSDEGLVYIRKGPPESVKRQFPTNGPTEEVWDYPDHRYIFQATSGFGDYKLVKVEPINGNPS